MKLFVQWIKPPNYPSLSVPFADLERVSRGTERRRLDAPAPGNIAAAHLRSGIAGLPQTPIPPHTDELLRPRRIPHPQRGRAELHLLHLQRINGGGAEQYGGSHLRYANDCLFTLPYVVTCYLKGGDSQ